MKNDLSLRIPPRGPLGANGMANSEYFESPTPYPDEQNFNKTHEIYCKMDNTFYKSLT